MIREKYKIYLKYLYENEYQIEFSTETLNEFLENKLNCSKNEFQLIHKKAIEKKHIFINNGIYCLSFDGIDYCEHCCLTGDKLSDSKLDLNYQPI